MKYVIIAIIAGTLGFFIGGILEQEDQPEITSNQLYVIIIKQAFELEVANQLIKDQDTTIVLATAYIDSLQNELIQFKWAVK